MTGTPCHPPVLRRCAVVVLAGALLAGSASAGDEGTEAALRRDLDALAQRVMRGPQPGADSPTAMVNRLLAAGDERLRPGLEEAWRVNAPLGPRGHSRYLATRWIIRVLYGRTTHTRFSGGPKPRLFDAEGVLRIRQGDGGSSGCGSCDEDPSPPAFEGLMGGCTLRTPTAPSGRGMLLRLMADPAYFAEWRGPTLDDMLRALGEACARDDVALDWLLGLARSPDAWRLFRYAAGRTESQEALPILQRWFRAAATIPPDGSLYRHPLAAACEALGHLDPEALRTEIRALDGPERDLALWCAGLDFAEPFLNEGLDAAITRAERLRALDDLAAFLTRFGELRILEFCEEIDAPPGPGEETMLRIILRAVALAGNDEEATDAAARVVAALLWPRTPSVSTSYSVNRPVTNTVTRSPYPGPRAGMRGLARALDRGLVCAADSSIFVHTPDHGVPRIDLWTPIHDLEDPVFPAVLLSSAVTPGRPEDQSTRCDVYLPADTPLPDGWREGDPMRDGHRVLNEHLGPSVRVTAERIQDGGAVRFALTNTGSIALCLDPTALDLVSASLTTVDQGGAKGAGAIPAPAEWPALRFHFGGGRRPWTVPADALLVLEPGASHRWTVRLRPEDREVTRFEITYDGHRVDGKLPAPLLLSIPARGWDW